jgi:pimeloyl-ACP methyl ester carboxylesterase
LICFAAAFVGAVITAFALVASSPPKIGTPRDVFGFASLKAPATRAEMPSLSRYPARDGEQLAYRLYDSSSDRILIFLHGSSYHGGGYQALASAISVIGAAKVVLPNLRGHYLSGQRRGDVDYIGQYEDDIIDLIKFLRDKGFKGPVTLGGHSSGGGLAIRFAGGRHDGIVSSYLMLAPIIPTSPAVRDGTAGGWASLHTKRLYGLLFLNALGIHGFNALPIIAFNKPAKYWDGTETLSYSYRLNASYHPRFRYAGDLRALGDNALVLVGADDEAVDGNVLRTLLAKDAPEVQMAILPRINHFGIFSDPLALGKIEDWLRRLPPP